MLEHLPGRVVTTKGRRFTIHGVYAAFPPEVGSGSSDVAPPRFSTEHSCCCEVEGEDQSRWLAEIGANDKTRLIRRLD